jgi:hypothetical protein
MGKSMSLHLIADLQANKDRFIRRVLETGQVWGLRSDDGWANCPSNQNDADVLLFWSDEAYAKRLAEKDWASYIPTPIDLPSFLDNWLQGMHHDMALAGVNFNSDLAGLEIDPLDLAKELLQQP